MKEVTSEKVIQIHDYLIEETGGNPGIRDSATLYFLVDAINREADLFRKAAYALLLAERHPFWDGQKRTAFMLADGILREGGYGFDKKDIAEIIRVLVRIAQYTCPAGGEIEKIAQWVKKTAVRLG